MMKRVVRAMRECEKKHGWPLSRAPQDAACNNAFPSRDRVTRFALRPALTFPIGAITDNLFAFRKEADHAARGYHSA